MQHIKRLPIPIARGQTNKQTKQKQLRVRPGLNHKGRKTPETVESLSLAKLLYSEPCLQRCWTLRHLGQCTWKS